MGATLTIDGLTIDKGLYDFITDEAMPGTGLEAKDFWPAFSKIVHELGPKNRALLAKRDDLQAKLFDVLAGDLVGRPRPDIV